VRGGPIFVGAWAIGAVVGFALGVPFGEAIYAIGMRAGLGFVSLYIGSFLVVGGLLGWFGLPIENRYLWWRINGAPEDPESVEGKKFSIRLAPISMFLVVGMLVGISHRSAPWIWLKW